MILPVLLLLLLFTSCASKSEEKRDRAEYGMSVQRQEQFWEDYRNLKNSLHCTVGEHPVIIISSTRKDRMADKAEGICEKDTK